MRSAAMGLVLAGCFPQITMKRIDFPVAPVPDGEGPGMAWQREVGVETGERVRFIVTGDVGVRAGNDTAGFVDDVSRHAERVCERLGGCDFALFLGNQIYPRGLVDSSDADFMLDLGLTWAWAGPQYFVLGTHDWGPLPWPGSAATLRRADRQLAWLGARRGADALQMRGDAHFYDFDAGPVHLTALDTTYLVHRCYDIAGELECRGANAERMLDWLRGPDEGWRIVVGHHPRHSNGAFGSAGDLGVADMSSGEALALLLDAHVMGRSHLYLGGHDHNLQVHLPDGDGPIPTASVVSGAGGRLTPFAHPLAHPDVAWQADAIPGYFTVEADADALVVQAWTADRFEPRFTTCLTSGAAKWAVEAACEPTLRAVRQQPAAGGGPSFARVTVPLRTGDADLTAAAAAIGAQIAIDAPNRCQELTLRAGPEAPGTWAVVDATVCDVDAAPPPEQTWRVAGLAAEIDGLATALGAESAQRTVHRVGFAPPRHELAGQGPVPDSAAEPACPDRALRRLTWSAPTPAGPAAGVRVELVRTVADGEVVAQALTVEAGAERGGEPGWLTSWTTHLASTLGTGGQSDPAGPDPLDALAAACER